MKKVFIICLLVLAMLNLPLFAAADNGARIDYNYQCDENSNVITIEAYICDIVDENGLVLVEYDIAYDAQVLQLESAVVNMPESWKPFVESGMAEDLSHLREDGVYWWSICNCAEDIGIRDDGELKITLAFKVLEKATTKVEFQCINVGNQKLEEVQCNSSTLTINLESESPDIETSHTSPSMPPKSDNDNVVGENTQNGSQSGEDDSRFVVENHINFASAASETSGDVDSSSTSYVLIGFAVCAIIVAAVFIFVKVFRKPK